MRLSFLIVPTMWRIIAPLLVHSRGWPCGFPSITTLLQSPACATLMLSGCNQCFATSTCCRRIHHDASSCCARESVCVAMRASSFARAPWMMTTLGLNLAVEMPHRAWSAHIAQHHQCLFCWVGCRRKAGLGCRQMNLLAAAVICVVRSPTGWSAMRVHESVVAQQGICPAGADDEISTILLFDVTATKTIDDAMCLPDHVTRDGSPRMSSRRARLVPATWLFWSLMIVCMVIPSPAPRPPRAFFGEIDR